jgi:uncharacterized membrane protein SpoIIM required for sporulation
MLELLINPRKAERKPWEMFFVGLFYSAVSILLVDWIFLKDPVLSKYSSMLIITFTVMFSIPFMYYIIKLEEVKNRREKSTLSIIKEHGRALAALVYLFLGFVVASAFFYIVLPPQITTINFQAQIEQYCAINSADLNACVQSNGMLTGNFVKTVGYSLSAQHFFAIFTNNIFVTIFVLVFSLAFGAGAIFILAWNASVIGAAIGIFTKAALNKIHLGLMRYMIHGIPEIAAYFIAALAGGILSIAIIKHEFGKEEFAKVMQDAIIMLLIAIIVLVFAAFIEVYVTPRFFGG